MITATPASRPVKVMAVFRHGDNVLALYATVADIVAFLRLWSTTGRVVDAVRLAPHGGRVQ